MQGLPLFEFVEIVARLQVLNEVGDEHVAARTRDEQHILEDFVEGVLPSLAVPDFVRFYRLLVEADQVNGSLLKTGLALITLHLIN